MICKHLFLLFIFLSSSASYGAKETLTFWTSNENVKKAFTQITQKFSQDFQVKVNIVVLTEKLTSQFQTAALSGKGPDIFAWAHDVVGELASTGLLAPTFLNKQQKKNVFQVALDAVTYRNQVYGYPYAVESLALIYNRKLIKNPPQTLKELILLAQTTQDKKKDLYGFLFDINKFFFTFPFLAAHGGRIFAMENGKYNTHKVKLNHSGSLLGLQFLHELVAKNLIPLSINRDIAFQKMLRKKLAMTLDGPWALQDLKRSQISYGVAPLPAFQGKRLKPFVGVHALYINRHSKKQELAREYIENYLLQEKSLLNLYQYDQRPLAHKNALQTLLKNKSIKKDLQGFITNIKNGLPMPNIPQMSAVWSTMNHMIPLYLSGKVTAKKALNLSVEKITHSLQ